MLLKPDLTPSESFTTVQEMTSSYCACAFNPKTLCSIVFMRHLMMLFFCVSGLLEVSAQSNAPEKLGVYTNTLGMKFKEMPGTPVLISVWETRIADFDAFLKDTHYAWEFKPHFPQSSLHPVVNTNIQDALAFCAWLTKKERAMGQLTDIQAYRLPTNREWDAAVGLSAGRSKMDLAVTQKVQDERAFPWGTEWPPPPKAGNFNSAEITGNDDGYVYTAPVGQFDPSPEGLYDLAGNVWEWAWDQEVRTDPVGTLRGGSWMYFRKESLFSNYRYQVPVDLRTASIGFRLVLEDKRRNALFSANESKMIADNEKSRRDKLTAKTEVNAEEVAKMREQLNAKPALGAISSLPDPSTLQPAKLGQVFTNALGMNFRPVGEASFLMGEHEVRIQDYQAWLDATHKTWDKKPTFEVKNTYPIINITWREAKDYCVWLTEKDRALKLIGPNDSYRLPADAEWSLAAGLTSEKGTTITEKDRSNKTDYPWGKEWPPPTVSANLDSGHMTSYQDNYSYTSPVGSFSPNSFHIFDLAGNVAEWCEDAWPDANGERVVRGSSWLTSAQEAMLSSARQHLPEKTTRPDLGFRCVLSLGSP
jgi:formylglycine-generating enzyme required for sulfatase activity